MLNILTKIKASADLIAIMAIGAFLRFVDLGSKSFWADELLSIWHSQDIVNIKTFLSPLRADDHPPLYFLILKLWGFFGNGEYYLRALSVIVGIITILAIYYLGREYFNRKASMFGALLVAISPMFLLYDREVRMYPLFTLLSILSILYFVKALKENKMIYWAMFTVATCLNTYTHYYSFLLIAGQWLFFILMFSKYRSNRHKFIISQLVIGLMYLPWVPTFLYHFGHSVGAGNFVRFPVEKGWIVKPLYLFFSFSLGQTILPWDYWVVIPGILVFTLLLALGIRAISRQKETAAIFLAMFVFPIFIALIFSELMPRYMVFLAPIYFLILGNGMEEIKKPLIQSACLAIIVLTFGFGLMNYYQNKEFHILATVDQWREVGGFLQGAGKKG